MIGRVRSLFMQKHKPILIRVIKGTQETIVECKAGDNLMDVTNRIVNRNINIYGLCDKQLACTTCRVDLQSHYNKVPAPSQEELDVLITTKNYQQQSSRMACQVFISEQMQGMIVRIEGDKGSLRSVQE